MNSSGALSIHPNKIIIIQAERIDDLKKKCDILIRIIEGVDISRDALRQDNVTLRQALKNHAEETAKKVP